MDRDFLFSVFFSDLNLFLFSLIFFYLSCPISNTCGYFDNNNNFFVCCVETRKFSFLFLFFFVARISSSIQCIMKFLVVFWNVSILFVCLFSHRNVQKERKIFVQINVLDLILSHLKDDITIGYHIIQVCLSL